MKMPKTITFDKMQIENVVIFMQENQWKVGVNLSLTSDEGKVGRNVVMQLDEAQQLQVRKFLKPFVKIVRDAMDIQDVINYVDPPMEEEAIDVVEPM